MIKKTPFFYAAMTGAFILDTAIFLGEAWLIQWLISLTGGHISFGVSCLVNLGFHILLGLAKKK